MTPLAAARVERARAAMERAGLPALLITRIENVGWLTGFTGTNGFVLLTADRAVFATDSRYTQQAAQQCPGFEQTLLATSAAEEITEVLAKAGVPRIGFEAAHLTVDLHRKYREKLPAAIELVPTTGLIDDLRMVKDPGEIALLEEACALTDRAFQHILLFLKPGAVERDIALELEWHIRRDLGAENAFDIIVASGPRSALPHGKASDRALRQGDLVTLDFGARVGGYCADITRTVVIGRATDEQKKVHGIVLDALARAIESIRPGAAGRDVDAVARTLIRDAGYGDYFGHGLGHSLGRTVHDGQAFSVRSEVTLAERMVVTVEPGIYIPEWGGVRVEDDVLVEAGGARVLTRSPRDLLEL